MDDAIGSELIIRAILKISNIDPRIDITEYRDIIKPMVATPMEVTAVLTYLVARDDERRERYSQEAGRRLLSVKEQIMRKKSQIRFNLLGDGGSVVYALVDTLRRIPDHRRFNFLFMHRANQRYTIFIDPAIFDNTIHGTYEDFALLDRCAIKNMDLNRAFLGNRLWKEVGEIAKSVLARSFGEPIPTDHKYVDWLYEFPTKELESFRVAEWFEKGRFKTEYEVEKYLGLTSNSSTSTSSPEE